MTRKAGMALMTEHWRNNAPCVNRQRRLNFEFSGSFAHYMHKDEDEPYSRTFHIDIEVNYLKWPGHEMNNFWNAYKKLNLDMHYVHAPLVSNFYAATPCNGKYKYDLTYTCTSLCWPTICSHSVYVNTSRLCIPTQMAECYWPEKSSPSFVVHREKSSGQAI